jgi:ABC-type polysaccharide/polyol phosphate export permease
LVRRDFERRFVGSAAGWLWAVIHPLVMLVCYVFMFVYCLRNTLPEGSVTQNYTLFLFAGYLPWILFQETVHRSASSLLENANLLTKTVFPAEVIPVSIFFSSLIGHLIALAIAIGVTGFWERHISAQLLLLPVYMLFTGLLGIGIGWIAASLHVYLRDTAQMVLVVLTLWFWVTPIFIPDQQLPERFQFLLRWNPMAYLVRGYRDRILSDAWPDPRELAILFAYSIAAFVIGGLFFRHLKRGFADVL